MKIHIYKIYFPTSKRKSPYYIGQTDDLKRRLLYQHLENNSNNLIGNALQKYNNWQVSILHTCKSRDEANRIEIEEIRNYNSIAPNGYNITRGGSDSNGFEGHYHTEEVKLAQSKRMQGNQHTKGHKHSKETKEKNRKAQLGNQYVKGKHWNLSEETKVKMRGNQNARGCKHSEEANLKKKNRLITEETKDKMRQSHQGLKQSKKTILKRQITQLKNKIANLKS